MNSFFIISYIFTNLDIPKIIYLTFISFLINKPNKNRKSISDENTLYMNYIRISIYSYSNLIVCLSISLIVLLYFFKQFNNIFIK